MPMTIGEAIERAEDGSLLVVSTPVPDRDRVAGALRAALSEIGKDVSVLVLPEGTTAELLNPGPGEGD